MSMVYEIRFCDHDNNNYGNPPSQKYTTIKLEQTIEHE